MLGGCESLDGLSQGPTDPGPVYPQGVSQSEMLDIQVFREETEMLLTNTTSESFSDGGRFWVNAQYSLAFESFAIGETKRLRLDDFVNEFGERFRAGGFFATERPDGVSLMQVEHHGKMLGMVVVKNEAQ